MLHPFDPKTRRKFFSLNKINYPKNNIINFYTNLKYVCMFNNQIKYKSGLKKLLIKQSQINILLIVFLLFVNIVWLEMSIKKYAFGYKNLKRKKKKEKLIEPKKGSMDNFFY